MLLPQIFPDSFNNDISDSKTPYRKNKWNRVHYLSKSRKVRTKFCSIKTRWDIEKIWTPCKSWISKEWTKSLMRKKILCSIIKLTIINWRPKITLNNFITKMMWQLWNKKELKLNSSSVPEICRELKITSVKTQNRIHFP